MGPVCENASTPGLQKDQAAVRLHLFPFTFSYILTPLLAFLHYLLAPTTMPSTLIVHGLAMSTCTQRVLLTAAELDVDVELVNVDFSTGEHKSEAHKKHQPFGAVPYLEDTEVSITFFE